MIPACRVSHEYNRVVTNMKIGIVSAMIRWERSLFDQIEWAAQNGFSAIELSCWSKQYQVEGLWAHRRDPNPQFLTCLRNKLASFQRVDIHASYNSAFDPVYVTYHPLCREIYVDEIRWAMKLAAFLDAQVVTCHSGWLIHGRCEKERERSLIDALHRLNALAEEYQVLLGMETLEYFLPLEHCELVRRLDLDRVRLTLDLGHIHRRTPPGIPVHDFSTPAYIAFGRSEAFIKSFAPYIVHVHVHDCDGERSHLGLGKGIVNFASIIQTLKEVGYMGCLSMETEGSKEEMVTWRSSLEREVNSNAS